MEDGGRNEPLLEVWLTQRGKSLYTPEGKVGYDEKDMSEWFAFWSDLRKRGASAAPDTQALDRGEIDSNLLSIGKTAWRLPTPTSWSGSRPSTRASSASPLFPTEKTARNPVSI